MDPLIALLSAVIPLALFHTVIAVDHYLPFIALGKSNGWTVKKTLSVAALCGMGHIVSSVLLGLLGIGLSIGASNLMDIQDIRGEFAVWFLIAFGLAYMAYGIRKAVKNVPHTHGHSAKTAWGLFVLFALVPCEPMIPVIMFPALTDGGVWGLAAVTLTYSFITIVTMVVMTFVGLKGLQMFRLNRLERYSHALAGFIVFACGLAVMALH
jgi:sulfite exporter TauE/SafE